MTEEEMERYFHERHAAQVGTHRGDIDEDTYDDITQNGLLPTTKDPNLWLVKCRIGEEKQLVLQLMRKYIAYQSSTDVNKYSINISINVCIFSLSKSSLFLRKKA